MYWPLGAPRVYAASRRKRKTSDLNDEEKEAKDAEEGEATNILGLRVARNGHLFVTITETALTVWQTTPVVVLASVTRSIQSLKKYGNNVGVLLRPDASIAVVQTSVGFLITYTIIADHNARVYQQLRDNGHGRKQSDADRLAVEEERRGFPEVNIRFRMVIKVDAGIGKVLTLDDELVVATEKPPAVQCIKWTPDNAGNQTSTELLSRATLQQHRVWKLILKGDGDPSQDVAHASVIFLVDAKLVLLQSSASGEHGLKYDMRVIANNVEYFDLMRDHVSFSGTPDRSLPPSPSAEEALGTSSFDRGLKDSLWYFDGSEVQCWMDAEDLIESASTSNDRDLPPPVSISADFYPTSVILNKGILLGIDADLVQRRDVQFAFFRFSIRTQLFLPPIFQRQLAHYDDSAASSLAHRYKSLPYFSHALEILLHTVLDDEVEKPPDPESALLPSVLSFLSSFSDYLDIVVQCTRKTEVRSWQTLFSHLPPPQELFERSLEKGMLKTAGGYLLVLHTFEEMEGSSEQCVRLLQRAKEVGDWDLCKELARFLVALDESGNTLREALERMDLNTATTEDLQLKTPRPNPGLGISTGHEEANGGVSPVSSGSGSFMSPVGFEKQGRENGDYFSQQR
ncbi:RAB6A-GEF complex partner protein 1, partial [Lecanoromycetidae sp. Uapishka_2]